MQPIFTCHNLLKQHYTLMKEWFWHPDHTLLCQNPDLPRGWIYFTQSHVIRKTYVLFWKIFFGLKVHDYPLVPKDRACIFVANHGSHYDGFLLYAGISKHDDRSLAPLVWYQMLDFPILGSILKTIRSVPINNEKGSATLRSRAKSLIVMIHCLKSGRHLFLQPEASPSDTLGSFHPGAALVALKTGAPLIPVTLRGVQPLFKDLNRFPRCWGRVNMLIHPPIFPSEAEGIKKEDQPAWLMSKVRARVASALDYPDGLSK